MAGAWTSVMLSKGVEVRGQAITAIGLISEVTKLVDVKGMLAVWGQTINAAKDFGLCLSISLLCLQEFHIALSIILS